MEVEAAGKDKNSAISGSLVKSESGSANTEAEINNISAVTSYRPSNFVWSPNEQCIESFMGFYCQAVTLE